MAYYGPPVGSPWSAACAWSGCQPQAIPSPPPPPPMQPPPPQPAPVMNYYYPQPAPPPPQPIILQAPPPAPPPPPPQPPMMYYPPQQQPQVYQSHNPMEIHPLILVVLCLIILKMCYPDFYRVGTFIVFD